MLALTLDLCFKGLQCVIKYMGPKKAKVVVAQYDSQVLVPYLVKVHKILNSNGVLGPTKDPTLTSILFGALVNSEEVNCTLLISEISLFWRLTCRSPCYLVDRKCFPILNCRIFGSAESCNSRLMD